ncbi:hypothetical protein ACHAXS_005418 [Conticribra weissflogii]
MADEARAMLDALMGADRNAPVQGASGIHHGPTSSHGGPRRQKRSCYDPDICPLYCAWSLSSATSPTWAESVAANENAGGIDVYDLFTNTKSDIGPNPYKVDDHAREEFASLPDHEKRRLGFEEMLARKLGDLVRQCDRTVARNKEKLRQEVARAMKQRTAGSGRGNREDLIVTVDPEMLENCAKNVAQAQLIEEEMAELVEEVEKLEEEEKVLVKEIEEKEAKEREEAEAKKKAEKESKTKEKSKKKEKKKDKDKSSSKTDDDPNATQLDTIDPRLVALQKHKLSKLLHLQSLSLQLPPLRDNTDNLLRQLQYLRSDTSTDKIVCEVSGNFMSSRDADERIAAHYAGKQYVGWKLVRDKLKELQKRGFGTGGGGGGDRGVRDMGRERDMRGPPPGYGDRFGGPPRGGGGYGGPPPPHHGGWGGNGGYGSGVGYSGSHRGRDRGGGGGGSDNHRRRSRSRDRDQRRDDRWERDRYRGRR